jgi:hypothetical protein
MLGENVSLTRPYGVLVIVWLLLNLPLLLGIHILPWDAIDQFYPSVYFNAHSLHHGIAPWWNPHIYAGYPQIADPQGMLFSPLLMAWMMIPSSPGASWFASGVLLHVLMGGAACLAVLRRMGANSAGALIGAIVFMVGGVAASRLEHVPIVVAYAYAPVVLLALKVFVARPGWGYSLLLGLATGAMLTQLVQVTYLLALMLIAYAVTASTAHWRTYSGRERLRWLGGSLLACLLALAIALPQLLLSYAFVTLSNRAELPLEASGMASLDMRAFLTLIVPNALHALRGTYSGPSSIVEAYFYLGALPSLMLYAVGAAWRDRQQRRQLVFFAVVALLATFYMFGLHTPFYGWLYAWLPGIKQFRRPADAAYLLNFAFAFAIGMAASHVDLRSRRTLTWMLGIATLWLLVASMAMRGDDARWQPAPLLAAMAAAIAWWWLRKAERDSRQVLIALLAVMVIDYRCFSLNGSFNETNDTARAFLRNDAANYLATQLNDAPGSLPARIEPVDASVFWDNLVVLRSFQSTQGYNPLRYALYDRWYGARDNGNLPRPSTPFNVDPGSPLTRLLATRYLVRNTSEHASQWTPPTGYERVFLGSHSEVWRNQAALPRLLTPQQAQVTISPTPNDFATADFTRLVLLTPRDSADEALARVDQARCMGQVHAHVAATTPTHIVLNVQTTQPGWLVMSELDFPGWTAEVDGAPLLIHRANGMFRAVCVPAGKHSLAFRFQPWNMVADALRQR